MKKKQPTVTFYREILNDGTLCYLYTTTTKDKPNGYANPKHIGEMVAYYFDNGYKVEFKNN